MGITFNIFDNQRDQDLLDSILGEAPKRFGMMVYFVPRKLMNMDNVFGEDYVSSFDEYYEIEAEINVSESFAGEGDFLSKFGLEIRDQVVFNIPRINWEKTVGDKQSRPMDGDLIFMPANNNLWEIKYVNNRPEMYEIGKPFTYKMTCELYTVSHEEFDTGIAEIDRYDKDVFDVGTEAVIEARIHVDLESGEGSFTIGEELYQGIDPITPNARGEVISWDPVAGIVLAKVTEGEFVVGTEVTGSESGVSYMVGYKERTVVKEEQSAVTGDYQETNDAIQERAEEIMDFSEDNPFSEGF